MKHRLIPRLAALLALSCISPWTATIAMGDDQLDDGQKLVAAVEQHRINAINAVIGSVIAIYDDDRQGGGSGVIIDPRGIALTNHHVIMGAGVEGWGGLADGEMYRWKLVGTDPGGDVSIIQMEGREEFPFTPLGDSDKVRVGDWALAMGNPFILTEDQSPTVTLGIVSGVKRYQPGAGMNQLVYGNCIQVDSSINPGNSGGPLFNLSGEVIGINGRGSFKERGRVNVGLGYAISSNQIKNFIPELLATKLVEHATLDASFSERDGKVVCSQLNLDAPVAAAGLKLGNELLEFEGIKIRNANQFTNLICTLPEGWPAKLKIRNAEDGETTIVIRCFGLPYPRPKVPPERGPDGERDPEKEKQQKRQREMVKLLAAPPGQVRFKEINQRYTQQLIEDWKTRDAPEVSTDELAGTAQLEDQLLDGDQAVGTQRLSLNGDGRFRVETKIGDQAETFVFDGKHFFAIKNGVTRQLSLVEAKLNLSIVQAVSMGALLHKRPFDLFGAGLIDGADKSQARNAYRLRLLDDDSDRFFVWLQMYGEDGRPAVRLLKASADKDCDESGGVTFSSWNRVGPLTLPLVRKFVFGLQETESLTIRNLSAKWGEPDETLFQVAQPRNDGSADSANSEFDSEDGDEGKQ